MTGGVNYLNGNARLRPNVITMLHGSDSSDRPFNQTIKVRYRAFLILDIDIFYPIPFSFTGINSTIILALDALAAPIWSGCECVKKTPSLLFQ